MTENQRLFIEAAQALVDGIKQADKTLMQAMHAATINAPDVDERMTEQEQARYAISLRLAELLDAAADYDDLFDMLGYGDAEALMLAAQKLAKRAAQPANPYFPFPKEPYYTGKAEPESFSREFATYPGAQIIPMPSINSIEPLLKIQALQDEIDQLRRDYNALLERVMEL